MRGRRSIAAVCRILVVIDCLSSVLLCGQAPAAKPRGQGPSSPAVSRPQTGPYYALVIGNNNYRYLKKLQTPINDAKAMAQLLHDVFGFQTKILLDADRSQIITALVEYRAQLQPNSNLLIYYAGHGFHDPDTDEAYWLPVDAQPGNNANWVSADDVTRDVRAIESAHILLISDSCYSGFMTRDADAGVRPSEHNAYVAKMMKSKSRNLMSSGGDEPVADAGAPGHSVFAWAVMESLRQMDDNTFTAAEVFERYIQPRVGGRSDQMPQYKPIRNSGHDSGDFVFAKLTGGSVGGAAPETASVTTTAPAPGQPGSSLTANADRSGGEAVAAPSPLPSGMDPALTELYRKAEAGNPQSMYDLGLDYHFGKGVPKDVTQAVVWFRKAAEAGNDQAMNDLGVCYENGMGVAIDYHQATDWYRKAAEDGYGVSMVNLAIAYERGLGVQKDYSQTLLWFRKAADAGNPRGMWGVGRMYKYGWGVDRDYQQALTWFRKSANAGDGQGWCGLGTLYENGWGVQRDVEQAVTMYQKSAALGNECGKEQLKRRAQNPSSLAP